MVFAHSGRSALSSVKVSVLCDLVKKVYGDFLKKLFDYADIYYRMTVVKLVIFN